MTGLAVRRLFMATAAMAILTGCQDGTGPFAKRPDATSEAPVVGAKSVKLVDRDVEAPQIFQTTDSALWDGRPSLGGVWVASPEANDPERVILRNPANGKFVIGALFRRERDNPGPTLQISSDAAAALGLLAGQPGKISVTALRREEAPQTAPDANKPILDAPETVATETLDPIPGAAAALDRATATATPAAAPSAKIPTLPAPPPKATAPKAPAPKPAAATQSSPTQSSPTPALATGGSVIQIGIFSVEANANRAAATLKSAGITATIRSESAQGKPFWSVTTRGDKAALDKVKKAGFKDAYFLKG